MSREEKFSCLAPFFFSCWLGSVPGWGGSLGFVGGLGLDGGQGLGHGRFSFCTRQGRISPEVVVLNGSFVPSVSLRSYPGTVQRVWFRLFDWCCVCPGFFV